MKLFKLTILLNYDLVLCFFNFLRIDNILWCIHYYHLSVKQNLQQQCLHRTKLFKKKLNETFNYNNDFVSET